MMQVVGSMPSTSCAPRFWVREHAALNAAHTHTIMSCQCCQHLHITCSLPRCSTPIHDLANTRRHTDMRARSGVNTWALMCSTWTSRHAHKRMHARTCMRTRAHTHMHCVSHTSAHARTVLAERRCARGGQQVFAVPHLQQQQAPTAHCCYQCAWGGHQRRGCVPIALRIHRR